MPGAGVHQPGEQLGEGGLARSRLADDGDPGAGRDVLGDVAEHQRPVGVAEVHVAEVDVERPRRQVGAVRPGVVEVGRGVEDADHAAPAGDGVLGVGQHLGAHLYRTHEQRHQEREREHLAGGDQAVEPELDADHDHAGVGQARRDAAQRERERGQPLGAGAGLLVAGDRLVDPDLGAVLDRVGADDGGAHDGLGDRGEHDADLAAHHAVGRGELALEVAEGEEQRQEAHPDHDRELPAVEEHHARGHHDLADADDPDDAAEHQELRDLVDVAGDARDQRAAALGALRQQREVVHVPERLDPQRGEATLGGGEQPRSHQVRRDAGDHDRDRGQHGHLHHEADVDAAGAVAAVEAAVERLLHRDRHDHPPGRAQEREQQGDGQPLAELRASSGSPDAASPAQRSRRPTPSTCCRACGQR